MAAGTVSYQKPEYGSLAGAMGEKIGSAIQMAAGARRRQQNEIEELQNKSDKTPEEEQRLTDLLAQKDEQGKGFFMKKALGAEFGGDLRRRTTGFFQRDPEKQNDPALDKQKRFDALVAAQPAEVQRVKQGELDLEGAGYKEQGALGKLSASIAEKFAILGGKVDALRQKEDSDKTPSLVVRMAENVRGIGSFFSKNNSLEEQQVKASEESLDQQIKAEDAAEAQRTENAAEARSRRAGGVGYDNERNGGKGGGLLGNIIDFGMKFLGRRGGRGRNRMPRMSGSRMYTNPIGPQRMGSSSPWARARGGAGINGFAPRMVSRVLPGRRKFASGGVIKDPTSSDEKKKLASGAVLDNPTPFGGGGDQAVVPKNTLETAVKQNQDNVKKADPFAKALQLPTIAAGSILMSTASNVVNKMGGIGQIFRPVIQKMFTPAAAAFGIPDNLVSAFFGGEDAKAGGGVELKGGRRGRKRQRKGAGGAAAATGGGAMGFMSPGMVTGGGSVDGYQITSGFGYRNTGIDGASRNHMGVDYGIPQGTPLAIKKPGKVIETTVPAMGNMGAVYIQHDDGTRTRYLHMSKVAVSPGATVVPGTLLGETGGQPGTPGAGPTSGPHLHFEYYPTRSSGPVDGSGVASGYFTVGGQVTSPSTPPPPPVASPGATSPTAAPGAVIDPSKAGITALPPIVLPAAGPQAVPPTPQMTAPITSPWAAINGENPYLEPPF